MSKRKEPISKIWQDTPDHLSHQIFSELELYATDKGYYPIQNALFRFMTQPQWNEKIRKQEDPRYPKLGQWTFDYWFDRLVEESYIEVDQVTRSIRCTHLVIVERENSDTPAS